MKGTGQYTSTSQVSDASLANLSTATPTASTYTDTTVTCSGSGCSLSRRFDTTYFIVASNVDAASIASCTMEPHGGMVRWRTQDAHLATKVDIAEVRTEHGAAGDVGSSSCCHGTLFAAVTSGVVWPGRNTPSDFQQLTTAAPPLWDGRSARLKRRLPPE